MLQFPGSDKKVNMEVTDLWPQQSSKLCLLHINLIGVETVWEKDGLPIPPDLSRVPHEPPQQEPVDTTIRFPLSLIGSRIGPPPIRPREDC